MLANRIRYRAVISLGVIADTIYIQLLQVRHIADAQGNLQRRDSAASLLVSFTSVWARISLSSPTRERGPHWGDTRVVLFSSFRCCLSTTGAIRGKSSSVQSTGDSVEPSQV